MRGLTWFALLGLVITCGCGDDAAADGMDAGSDGDEGADVDAGAPPPVWMPRDTGPRGGDPEGTDYSQQCTLLLDYGANPKQPPCAASTRDCIDGCAADDEGCADRCIDANPIVAAEGEVDCAGCTLSGLFQCFKDEGCETETNNFLCCFEEECLGGEDNCTEEMCGARQTAVFQCAVTKTPQCVNHTGDHNSHCFADSDQDAGL